MYTLRLYQDKFNIKQIEPVKDTFENLYTIIYKQDHACLHRDIKSSPLLHGDTIDAPNHRGRGILMRYRWLSHLASAPPPPQGSEARLAIGSSLKHVPAGRAPGGRGGVHPKIKVLWKGLEIASRCPEIK
jgi:hypothetical protein